MSVALRESCDKIHCNMREWFGINNRGNVKRWGFDVVGQVLVLLTSGASFDVFRYPCPGARPEVFLVHASDCFISSGVAVEGSIVPRVHNLAFQSLVRGNDEAVFGDVSPEWGVRSVYSFNGECAFPFFHEGAIVVLDDRDKVFYRSGGIFVCDANE
jgi:hypothetical protein